MVLLAPIHKVERRYAIARVSGTALPQHDQPLRIAERQRLEQHRIHQTENRAVGANAQREHGHGNGCEAGIPPQHAQRESQIVNERRNTAISFFASVQALERRARRQAGDGARGLTPVGALAPLFVEGREHVVPKRAPEPRRIEPQQRCDHPAHQPLASRSSLRTGASLTSAAKRRASPSSTRRPNGVNE